MREKNAAYDIRPTSDERRETSEKQRWEKWAFWAAATTPVQLERTSDAFTLFMQNKANERQAKPGKEDAFAYIMS